MASRRIDPATINPEIRRLLLDEDAVRKLRAIANSSTGGSAEGAEEEDELSDGIRRIKRLAQLDVESYELIASAQNTGAQIEIDDEHEDALGQIGILVAAANAVGDPTPTLGGGDAEYTPEQMRAMAAQLDPNAVATPITAQRAEQPQTAQGVDLDGDGDVDAFFRSNRFDTLDPSQFGLGGDDPPKPPSDATRDGNTDTGRPWGHYGKVVGHPGTEHPWMYIRSEIERYKAALQERRRRKAALDERRRNRDGSNQGEEQQRNQSEDQQRNQSEDQQRNQSEDQQRNQSEDQQRNQSEDQQRNQSEEQQRNQSEDQQRNQSEDQQRNQGGSRTGGFQDPNRVRIRFASTSENGTNALSHVGWATQALAEERGIRIPFNPIQGSRTAYLLDTDQLGLRTVIDQMSATYLREPHLDELLPTIRTLQNKVNEFKAPPVSFTVDGLEEVNQILISARQFDPATRNKVYLSANSDDGVTISTDEEGLRAFADSIESRASGPTHKDLVDYLRSHLSQSQSQSPREFVVPLLDHELGDARRASRGTRRGAHDAVQRRAGRFVLVGQAEFMREVADNLLKGTHDNRDLPSKAENKLVDKIRRESAEAFADTPDIPPHFRRRAYDYMGRTMYGEAAWPDDEGNWPEYAMAGTNRLPNEQERENNARQYRQWRERNGMGGDAEADPQAEGQQQQQQEQQQQGQEQAGPGEEDHASNANDTPGGDTSASKQDRWWQRLTNQSSNRAKTSWDAARQAYKRFEEFDRQRQQRRRKEWEEKHGQDWAERQAEIEAEEEAKREIRKEKALAYSKEAARFGGKFLRRGIAVPLAGLGIKGIKGLSNRVFKTNLDTESSAWEQVDQPLKRFRHWKARVGKTEEQRHAQSLVEAWREWQQETDSPDTSWQNFEVVIEDAWKKRASPAAVQQDTGTLHRFHPMQPEYGGNPDKAKENYDRYRKNAFGVKKSSSWAEFSEVTGAFKTGTSFAPQPPQDDTVSQTDRELARIYKMYQKHERKYGSDPQSYVGTRDQAELNGAILNWAHNNKRKVEDKNALIYEARYANERVKVADKEQQRKDNLANAYELLRVVRRYDDGSAFKHSKDPNRPWDAYSKKQYRKFGRDYFKEQEEKKKNRKKEKKRQRKEQEQAYADAGSDDASASGGASGEPGAGPTGGADSGPGAGPTGGADGGPGAGPTGGADGGPGAGPTGGADSGPGAGPTGGADSGPGAGPTGGSDSGPGAGPTGGDDGGPGAGPTDGDDGGDGTGPQTDGDGQPEDAGWKSGDMYGPDPGAYRRRRWKRTWDQQEKKKGDKRQGGFNFDMRSDPNRTAMQQAGNLWAAWIAQTQAMQRRAAQRQQQERTQAQQQAQQQDKAPEPNMWEQIREIANEKHTADMDSVDNARDEIEQLNIRKQQDVRNRNNEQPGSSASVQVEINDMVMKDHLAHIDRQNRKVLQAIRTLEDNIPEAAEKSTTYSDSEYETDDVEVEDMTHEEVSMYVADRGRTLAENLAKLAQLSKLANDPIVEERLSSVFKAPYKRMRDALNYEEPEAKVDFGRPGTGAQQKTGFSERAAREAIPENVRWEAQPYARHYKGRP